MNLYKNELPYLSPSAFQQWLMCPMKFWLSRLSGYPIKNEQGLAAAMGSAVDAILKRYMAKQMGLQDEPRLQLESLIKSVELEEGTERDQVFQVTNGLVKKYVELGFPERLIAEGIHDLECDIFQSLEWDEVADIAPALQNPLVTKKEHHTIRLRGLPDGVMKKKNLLLPWDIKVRGYGAKKGYSPTPGYRCYVTSDGKSKDMHPKCGTPLEELNYNWAIQMCIYFWLLNPDYLLNPDVNLTDIPIAIDEMCFGQNTIVFTQIRTTISSEFQSEVWQTIQNCWKECHDPPTPIPEKRKCHAYRQVCECAPYCTQYGDVFDNVDLAIYE